MGQKHETHICCVGERQQSILEVSFFESFRSSFQRNSSYESPIPDEICIQEQEKSFTEDNLIGELSTDFGKKENTLKISEKINSGNELLMPEIFTDKNNGTVKNFYKRVQFFPQIKR